MVLNMVIWPKETMLLVPSLAPLDETVPEPPLKGMTRYVTIVTQSYPFSHKGRSLHFS